MTLAQAKQLKYGDYVYWHRGDKVVRYKVNGAPKTWKRSPERVEIPLKYGLYEYFRINEEAIHHYHLTVEEALRS